MFIELVDALRCPNAHEESWLVAATRQMEARHIVEGTLGCPVCAAEYPIHRGVADFRRAPAPPRATRAIPDERAAVRLAALLDLTDAGGFAVLIGDWGVHAVALSALVEAPLLLVDPPAGIEGAPGISVLRADEVLPLAPSAARGVALDETLPARVQAAVHATRAGGRVVAPLSTPRPDGVRELAHDDALWVGERESAPQPFPLLSLHVRRR